VETLILVRHGATNWNASHFCQGHKDVALNETGRRQIELLQRALSGYEIDRAFASPLQRAQETCRILGPEPAVLDDLIEIDRGHWEGHEMEEIRRRWGKFVASKRSWPAKESRSRAPTRRSTVCSSRACWAGRPRAFGRFPRPRVPAASS
jgi:broad specificity phosphatase PhoE